MSSPTLAELPKIPTNIAEGVCGKVDLKKVEVHEKNVLPTKEDVVAERQHVEMLSGIENFAAAMLKPTTTEEKCVLPSPDDVRAEKTYEALHDVTAAIEQFSPEKLKHTTTEEKVILPSKEDLAREKSLHNAASFDHSQLKHVEPEVKTHVEDVRAEKTYEALHDVTAAIEQFSPEKLKHTTTEEKVILPSKEDLAREKSLHNAASFDHSQLKHVEPEVKTHVEVIDA